MIKLSFCNEDINHLQNIVEHHPHPFVRRKALALLLKSKGLPHHQICGTIGICGNTFHSYCDGFQNKGIEFVEEINFYKPQSSLRSFDQVVKDYFEKTPPATIAQACHDIEKLTGVALKNTQMRTYIKAMGIAHRKVASVPAKVNIEEQKKFHDTALQPRLSEAIEGKRTVYFVDAAHFVLGAFLGYLWSLTRLFVKTPSGRQRFNVLGALNAVTKELFTITNETYITSTQVCELLRKLTQNTTSPITIVLDNARYQRCRLVMDLAKELGVELLFLPSYSPNLNLIERLWKLVKKECLYSHYYENFTSFRGAIQTFLDTMNQTHQKKLDSLLTLNFQMFEEEQIRVANL